MNSNEKKLQLHEEAVEIERIGSRAVHDVQAKNRENGIPSVYAANGTIYYEMPDGTITTENPFKDDANPDVKSVAPDTQ